jgi:hypothetical protein
MGHSIVGYVRRLGREIVAAHVRRDGQVITAELRQQVLPGIPELGEAVHEEDQLALTGSSVVQLDAIHVRVLVSIERTPIRQRFIASARVRCNGVDQLRPHRDR